MVGVRGCQTEMEVRSKGMSEGPDSAAVGEMRAGYQSLRVSHSLRPRVWLARVSEQLASQ